MTPRRAIRTFCLLATISAVATVAGEARHFEAISVTAEPSAPVAPPDDFTPVEARLKAHCSECHDDKKHKGDLSLQAYRDQAFTRAGREVFEHVLDKVGAGEMPPKSKLPFAALGFADPGVPAASRTNRHPVATRISG